MSISPAANSFLICLLTSQLHIVAILLPHQPSGSLAFAITRLAGDCRSAPCLCLFRSRSSCAIADTVRVQSVREFKARTEAAHVRFARTVQCSAVQCERARACPCAATLVAYSLPLSRSMRAGRGASVPRRSQTARDKRNRQKCSDLDFSLLAFVSGVVFCSPASSEPLLYLYVCICMHGAAACNAMPTTAAQRCFICIAPFHMAIILYQDTDEIQMDESYLEGWKQILTIN